MASIYEEDLWYTRMRYNPQGELVEADFLTEDDLPEHSHTIEDISNWNEGLTSIIKEVVSTMFVNNTQKAVKFQYNPDTGTMYADVRYDEITIDKNEDGELYALGGGESGSTGVVISGECATHTHLAKDIEDFEEAVEKLLGNKKITANDLYPLLDGTTIYINQNGTLTVGGSGTVKSHTHTISEIKDFPVIIPAALQPLDDLGDDIDYSGAVDLSDLTIGYSILAINKWLGTVLESKLENLQNQINQLKRDSASGTQLLLYVKPSVQSNFLLDKQTNKIVEVYRGSQFEIQLDYLPYNSGKMYLMIDGKEFAKVDVGDLPALYSNVGYFTVCKVTVKGLTACKSISIPLKNLPEGPHEIYISFVPDETRVNESNRLNVVVTDKDMVNILASDINPTTVVAGKTYYKEFNGAWKAYIKDFENLRYVNQSGFDERGEAYFIAPYPETKRDGRRLPNLFGYTSVEVKFNYDTNVNDCELIKLIVGNPLIVNNVVVGPGDKEISLKLPNSRLYNSVRVWGLDLAEIGITKGTTYTNERVYEDGYVVSFTNKYHDQKSDMVLDIKSKSDIDLTKIKYELLNLSIN